MLLTASVSWFDGLPGTLTVQDSCAGPLPINDAFEGYDTAYWTIPSTIGTLCTITVHTTNLQGVSQDVAAQYRISR
jgi:hypothetical protein